MISAASLPALRAQDPAQTTPRREFVPLPVYPNGELDYPRLGRLAARGDVDLVDAVNAAEASLPVAVDADERWKRFENLTDFLYPLPAKVANQIEVGNPLELPTTFWSHVGKSIMNLVNLYKRVGLNQRGTDREKMRIALVPFIADKVLE